MMIWNLCWHIVWYSTFFMNNLVNYVGFFFYNLWVVNDECDVQSLESLIQQLYVSF